MERDEWLVFVFNLFLLAVGGGSEIYVDGCKVRRFFSLKESAFFLVTKTFRRGCGCPFELILKDGFSLSFSLLFCQRLLRLDKGEDKAKQSGLSSRRLLLILNFVCLSTTKKGFAQVLWLSVIMIDQVSSTERKFLSSHDGS